MILALSERVARVLRKPLALGGGSTFRATVIGKAELSELDPRTTAMPAAMTFLRTLVVNRDRPREVLEALEAFEELPHESGVLYFDLTLRSLSHAVRRAVERLMQHQGYEPKSRLVRNFIERGRREGREEVRQEALAIVRATIRSVLVARGIALGTEDDARLEACSDPNVLMKWATSAATAIDAAGVFDAK